MPKIRPPQSKGYISTPYKKKGDFKIFEDDPTSTPPDHLGSIQLKNLQKSDNITLERKPFVSQKQNHESVNSRAPFASVNQNSLRPLAPLHQNKIQGKVSHAVPLENKTFPSSNTFESLKNGTKYSTRHLQSDTMHDENQFEPTENIDELIKWESWMDDLEPQVAWKRKEVVELQTFYCEETNSHISISGVVEAPLMWRTPPLDEKRLEIIKQQKKQKKPFVPMKMII